MTDSRECICVLEARAFIEARGSATYRLEREIIDKAEVFSLAIESYIDGEYEREYLEDVSRDFDEAADLLLLFAKNIVTPIDAAYVMEDLLS